MQKSNSTVKTEKINVNVNNCNPTEVNIENNAENLTESSRKTQDECHLTNTGTCESEKTTPYRGLCEKCNQKFSNLYQYKYHMKIMHDEEEQFELNRCTICLYEFANNSALVSHMRLHTGEKPFDCKTCGKKFAFKTALVKHNCIDDEQPYCASTCADEKVSDPSDLKCHMKTHTGEKLFKCDQCKQTYSEKNLFEKHMISHNNGHEKLVTCDICNQNFTCKQDLVKHIETAHSTAEENVQIEARYSCKVCNAKFQRQSQWFAHRKTHSLRVYVCEICNRSFKYEGSYIIHLRKHSSNPLILHSCKVCHQEFRSSAALVHHMRLHTGEKPFKCDTCDKKFAFKVALVKHYCVDGNQPFMRKVAIKEEPKVCNTCHARFKSEVTLANHMKMHTGHKPFTCNMCDKKFAFKVGLVTHVCINGEKPYMRKTDKVQKSIEPIHNIKTVKVERIESETEIEEGDMIEIKIERDEMESGDIGMAEIEIEAIKIEIKEEY